MESQPQNPEFKYNPGNLQDPCFLSADFLNLNLKKKYLSEIP